MSNLTDQDLAKIARAGVEADALYVGANPKSPILHRSRSLVRAGAKAVRAVSPETGHARAEQLATNALRTLVRRGVLLRAIYGGVGGAYIHREVEAEAKRLKDEALIEGHAENIAAIEEALEIARSNAKVAAELGRRARSAISSFRFAEQEAERAARRADR